MCACGDVVMCVHVAVMCAYGDVMMCVHVVVVMCAHVVHLVMHVYQLQLNTGQTLASDAGRDLNVVPVWLQGITGCNSYVAIVDDGEPCRGGVVRGR